MKTNIYIIVLEIEIKIMQKKIYFNNMIYLIVFLIIKVIFYNFNIFNNKIKETKLFSLVIIILSQKETKY